MKKFVLTVLLLLSFFSCTKEEDKKTKLAYFGQWSLIQFSKLNYTETYNAGEIIWEFNKYDELTVTVNTDLSNSQLPIKEPGVYQFVGAQDVVSIQDTQYAAKVQQDTLILSRNAAAGGPVIKFIKMQTE